VTVSLRTDYPDDADGSEAMPVELIAVLEEVQSLLISVSTSTSGQKRIHFEEDRYQSLRRKLNQGLARHGLTGPFPWRSLSDWYGKWMTMPTYQDRRAHISGLASPIVAQLERLAAAVDVDDVAFSESEPT
jgi:hypothetical protein